MKRLLLAFFLVLMLAPGALACKNIIALNEVTAGDYNLLLKVRDPSRQGLQVLWQIDAGYQYDYHTPWTGQLLRFTVKHAFFGVATQGDIPPNVFKPGMALSNAGIAYGDADLPSYWINPSPYAWDDFDWIRYACQNASTEKEAVDLLIDAVGMHATGVPENLVVVGPREGYVIEATAYHFDITNVDSVAIRSNYPKDLWNQIILKNLFVASSFDRVFEGELRRGRAIRLGAPMGIRLVSVDDESVVIRQIPFGATVTIKKGQGEMAGFYWVDVLDCDSSTARLRVSYRYYAWENEMRRRIQAVGAITPADMMAWSRLHSWELSGMRGMCEADKKASMVFQIPLQSYHLLSMGWFAPDQCAAIYVPVHIADISILPAYRNGEAAELALSLLNKFGHGNLTNACVPVESVFLHENSMVEALTITLIEEDIRAVLTVSDSEMQQQAMLMQNIYLSATSTDRQLAASVWNTSYSVTLENIEHALIDTHAPEVQQILSSLAASIAKGRADIAFIVAHDESAQEMYREGERCLASGNYNDAVDIFIDTYQEAQHALLIEQGLVSIDDGEKQKDVVAAVFGVLIATILLWYIVRRWW